MKTIILSLTILLTTTICFAQEEKPKTLFVNGKDINKLGIEFIEIAAYNTSMYGKKWGIAIDIGQEYVSWKGSKYRDEKGGVVDFDSPMDALNYIVECGWEFVSNNGGAQGNVTNLFYLLRKKKESTENINQN